MVERQVAAYHTIFDDAPSIEHYYPLAEVTHQAQVMGYQQEGRALAATQRVEPFQQLRSAWGASCERLSVTPQGRIDMSPLNTHSTSTVPSSPPMWCQRSQPPG